MSADHDECREWVRQRTLELIRSTYADYDKHVAIFRAEAVRLGVPYRNIAPREPAISVAWMARHLNQQGGAHPAFRRMINTKRHKAARLALEYWERKGELECSLGTGEKRAEIHMWAPKGWAG